MRRTLVRLAACCGNGQFGRLGNGSQANELFLRVLPQLQGVQSVAAGGAHTAVVTEAGELWTFGINNHGQLGHSQDNRHVEEPVEVILPDTITAAAAGESHTLALSSSGEVWAAGSNGDGQLGLGPEPCIKNAEFRLVKALAGTRITAVAAGQQHSLALSQDGRVFAWGSGHYGSLGLGTRHLRWQPLPMQLTALAGVRVAHIAAGAFHSGAVDEDGNAWVWGHGGGWQLGTGVRAHECIPQQLQGLANVAQLALGFEHSLSIGKHGEVFSWGTDENGSLGQGFKWPQPGSQVPARVGVVRLKSGAAGWKHTAGVSDDGRLFTWGWGGAVGSAGLMGGATDLGAGQLGHGDEMDEHTPKQVQRLLLGPRGGFRDLRSSASEPWFAAQVACARNHTVAVVEVDAATAATLC